MNNYISKDEVFDAVSGLVDQALRAQRDQVKAKVWQRVNQIERILHGGRTIFEEASGPRFAQIYDLRQKLYIKAEVLFEVLGYLNES